MSELICIYQKYSGKSNSDKLTIFKGESIFQFVYQTFRRTNPSQAERKSGFKPKRILVSEQTFEFSNLELVDFTKLPFHHLMYEFDLAAQQP